MQVATSLFWFQTLIAIFLNTGTNDLWLARLIIEWPLTFFSQGENLLL